MVNYYEVQLNVAADEPPLPLTVQNRRGVERIHKLQVVLHREVVEPRPFCPEIMDLIIVDLLAPAKAASFCSFGLS